MLVTAVAAAALLQPDSDVDQLERLAQTGLLVDLGSSWSEDDLEFVETLGVAGVRVQIAFSENGPSALPVVGGRALMLAAIPGFDLETEDAQERYATVVRQTAFQYGATVVDPWVNGLARDAEAYGGVLANFDILPARRTPPLLGLRPSLDGVDLSLIETWGQADSTLTVRLDGSEPESHVEDLLDLLGALGSERSVVLWNGAPGDGLESAGLRLRQWMVSRYLDAWAVVSPWRGDQGLLDEDGDPTRAFVVLKSFLESSEGFAINKRIEGRTPTEWRLVLRRDDDYMVVRWDPADPDRQIPTFEAFRLSFVHLDAPKLPPVVQSSQVGDVVREHLRAVIGNGSLVVRLDDVEWRTGGTKTLDQALQEGRGASSLRISVIDGAGTVVTQVARVKLSP